MQAYDPAAAEAVFGAARDLFDALVVDLGALQAAAWTHDELEDVVEVRGRELLRRLVQGHLDLRAARERGQHLEAVAGADGTVRRSVETGHVRQLVTRFGRVRVERLAYRAKGASNLHPADGVLNLPQEMHSHTLRRMAAVEAVRGSFTDACEAINRTTGAGVGKRQVEQLTVRAAGDIDAFYTDHCPMPCTDGTLLVLTVDGKGVVMRPEALREETAKAAAAKGGNLFKTRLSGGEKQGRKRMATLGAVYDADPAPRRPQDVIHPADTGPSPRPPTGELAEPDHCKGPRACGKWLTGSVAATSADVVAAVFDQAQQRDPTHRRPWIALVDGAAHQLDLIQHQAAARGVHLHIIVDFVHVLEYLWRAAWCFHDNADPQAEAWVAAHALTILDGHSDHAAKQLQAQAAAARLTDEQRKGVNACTGYLEAKKEYLAYDTALAAGWPIATGVIEGACRHLVKDRLDITGARWGLQGAEAVLKLRALHSNGDFDAYLAWHLKQEHQRVHQARYPNDLTLAA